MIHTNKKGITITINPFIIHEMYYTNEVYHAEEFTDVIAGDDSNLSVDNKILVSCCPITTSLGDCITVVSTGDEEAGSGVFGGDRPGYHLFINEKRIHFHGNDDI